MRTVFFIPALRAPAPVVAAGCCAVPAALLVERELRGWRAAQRLRVETAPGVACVEHVGSLDPRTVAEALRELGLLVAAWTAAARGSGDALGRR